MAEQKEHEDVRFGEIDFGDPRAVEAWIRQVDASLDNSDRQAVAEEISRQFRRSPAGVPTSGLESELERTQERLNWVIEQMDTQESPEVRFQVGQLRERFLEDIEALRQRVSQLQLDDPGS